jgi:hypothetical protein
MTKPKPNFSINPHHRIDGGTKMPIHGTVNYGMVCKNGDGVIFGEDGRQVTVVSSFSYESVGNDLPGNVDSNQPFVPAKWIRAKNGDILIEAPNGSIYLNARNVVIAASGVETDTQKNGNVDIIASNEINIHSSDTVKIDCTNGIINASLEMNICGKGFLNMGGQFTQAGSAVDTSKGVLGATGQVLKNLTSLGGL